MCILIDTTSPGTSLIPDQTDSTIFGITDWSDVMVDISLFMISRIYYLGLQWGNSIFIYITPVGVFYAPF